LPPRKSCVGFRSNIFEFFLTDIKQRLIDYCLHRELSFPYWRFGLSFDNRSSLTIPLT